MGLPTGRIELPIGQQPSALTEKAMKDGIEEAYRKWLVMNPFSAPDAIKGGIEAAVTKWLDAHKTEVIAAIAAKVTLKGK